MLTQLIHSLCNTGEGVTDAYDVVLTSIAKHKDADTEAQVQLVALDVFAAISNRPALRRVVSLYLAAVIASDRFARGEDFNTAMNESRDMCQEALTNPNLLIDIKLIYEAKKTPILALFNSLDDAEDFELGEEDKYAVIIKAVHSLLEILRAPVPEVEFVNFG